MEKEELKKFCENLNAQYCFDSGKLLSYNDPELLSFLNLIAFKETVPHKLERKEIDGAISTIFKLRKDSSENVKRLKKGENVKYYNKEILSRFTEGLLKGDTNESLNLFIIHPCLCMIDNNYLINVYGLFNNKKKLLFVAKLPFLEDVLQRWKNILRERSLITLEEANLDCNDELRTFLLYHSKCFNYSNFPKINKNNKPAKINKARERDSNNRLSWCYPRKYLQLLFSKISFFSQNCTYDENFMHFAKAIDNLTSWKSSSISNPKVKQLFSKLELNLVKLPDPWDLVCDF